MTRALAGRANSLLKAASSYEGAAIFISNLTLKGFIMQTTNAIAQSAQFSFDVIDNAPAVVVVTGDTLTEKKISAVQQASVQAKAFLCSAKGKIGKEAREGFSLSGFVGIANAAGRGHYKPLADAIAAITGETISISSRSAYDTLIDRFADRMHDLKNNGYTVRKDGTLVESSKRKTLVQVIGLLTQVQQHIEAEKAAVSE